MDTALLARNVNSLIKKSWGTVNATAEKVGVPQKSLARIAANQSPRPSHDVLQRLMDYYGASYDWLVLGRGEPPPLLDEAEPENGGVRSVVDTEAARSARSRQLDWSAIIRELAVSREVAKALEWLPEATSTALHFVAPRAGQLEESEDEWLQRWELRHRLTAREYEMWVALFRALIDKHGIEAIRDSVTSHVDELRVGFNPFAIYLLRLGAVAPHRDRYFATHDRPRSFLLSDALGAYPQKSEEAKNGNALLDRLAWSPPAPEPHIEDKSWGLKKLRSVAPPPDDGSQQPP